MERQAEWWTMHIGCIIQIALDVCSRLVLFPCLQSVRQPVHRLIKAFSLCSRCFENLYNKKHLLKFDLNAAQGKDLLGTFDFSVPLVRELGVLLPHSYSLPCPVY